MRNQEREEYRISHDQEVYRKNRDELERLLGIHVEEPLGSPLRASSRRSTK
jgi:hypothetical protein